jgi:hypothetical protein
MVGGAIFPKRPNSPPACYPKHERPALPATGHPHQILSSLWVVSSVPGEPPCRPVRAIVAFCSACAVRSNTMAPRPPQALGLPDEAGQKNGILVLRRTIAEAAEFVEILVNGRQIRGALAQPKERGLAFFSKRCSSRVEPSSFVMVNRSAGQFQGTAAGRYDW